MRVSLCDLLMKNMDWTRILDTWKSTKIQRVLPLELDDDQVHYVRNRNYFSASFYCTCFFNIVRHHVIFIFNTKQPKSSFSFSGEVLQKNIENLSEVWLFGSPSHWTACAHFKLEHCSRVSSHCWNFDMQNGFPNSLWDAFINYGKIAWLKAVLNAFRINRKVRCPSLMYETFKK
jgi:hypothetical protein